MTLHPILSASLLALAASASAAAAPVTATSYDMHNGDGQASGGSYNYWDKAYNGSGSTTTDNAPLSGGTGDLTDGVITTLNWFQVENGAGTGPYVGWFSTPTPTVDVKFNFAAGTSVDAIHIHADDSGGAGGVSLPKTVMFTWDTGSTSFSVVDPSASLSPSWLDFTGLGITGASFVTVSLGYGNLWIFVDEITFDGAAGVVPEPSTYALMALGLAGIGFMARRRRS